MIYIISIVEVDVPSWYEFYFIKYYIDGLQLLL